MAAIALRYRLPLLAIIHGDQSGADEKALEYALEEGPTKVRRYLQATCAKAQRYGALRPSGNRAGRQDDRTRRLALSQPPAAAGVGESQGWRAVS